MHLNRWISVSAVVLCQVWLERRDSDAMDIRSKDVRMQTQKKGTLKRTSSISCCR